MRRATELAIGLALVAGVAIAKQPSPVILDLGPVFPTPVPSPEVEGKIRLITSLTINNKPDGLSTMNFAATDFGRIGKSKEDGGDKFRTLATEQYSLVETKPKARALRDEIVGKIRDLERDLLRYVEIVGPPRVRQPFSEQPGMRRPGR